MLTKNSGRFNSRYSRLDTIIFIMNHSHCKTEPQLTQFALAAHLQT